MSAELGKFLAPYICTGVKDENGKSVFTHTSLQPRASYNIPDDKRKELHRLIAQSICARKPVFLTEKPLPVSCIKVDIDLKYPLDYSTRQHDDRHIHELLKLYADAINTYVDLPENYPIDAYVFQRKNPYRSNGNMKDGIHILYPDICISTDIQHVIRGEVLKKIDMFLRNPDIGCLNTKNSNDDVVDLSVISRNNWLMYGARKQGTLPYMLYKVLRHTPSENESNFEEISVPSKGEEAIYNLINKLSIHRVPKECTFEVQPDMHDIIEAYNEKKSKKTKPTYKSTVIKKQMKQMVDDDTQRRQMEEATKLVTLLADWRAEGFASWIEVGLCLNNISPNLQNVWIEFSKRSDSWQESDAKKWQSFSSSVTGLNIGSLHRWARLDNPKKYAEVRSEFLEPLMMCSVTCASQDVAQVIKAMYEHQYVCLDSKGRRWAEYINHGWKITEDGMSLKKRLGKEVLNEYLYLVNRYNNLAITHNDDKKDHYLHRSRSLAEVSYKLRDISFKDKVMKECIILFHDRKFEESLDSNSMLVGMENGVYDLKEGLFRDGRPEDRISLSTGNDFPSFDESSIDTETETSTIPEVQEIFDFMKEVLPIDVTRRYMWKFLASCLQGYNSDEKFHIFTGVGGNGKSKLIELYEMAYGQYCFKMPINFITSKRTQTGQATPELRMGRRARFGSMQEPDEGATINTGLMKELTGNDKMFIRGLYEAGEEFKPQFSLVLLCNHKPKMTSDDEGTWRRMVVIDFIAKFVEGTPNGPYEFRRNTDLVHSFPYWAPWFFAMLTQFYKVYKTEGLIVPKEVAEATKEYRKDSDAYAMFIDDYFIPDPDGVIKLEQSYCIFRDWYQNEYGEKAPPRKNFKMYIERKLNKRYGIGNKSGWYGWSIQHPDIDQEEVIEASL